MSKMSPFNQQPKTNRTHHLNSSVHVPPQHLVSQSEAKLQNNAMRTGRSMDNFLDGTIDGSTGAGQNSSSVFNIHGHHAGMRMENKKQRKFRGSQYIKAHFDNQGEDDFLAQSAGKVAGLTTEMTRNSLVSFD